MPHAANLAVLSRTGLQQAQELGVIAINMNIHFVQADGDSACYDGHSREVHD
jgi:hypothetical protein